MDQVAIGSCTNSSYTDMMTVAALLKGKSVHPDVSLISRTRLQAGDEYAGGKRRTGRYFAGARILECGCKKNETFINFSSLVFSHHLVEA